MAAVTRRAPRPRTASARRRNSTIAGSGWVDWTRTTCSPATGPSSRTYRSPSGKPPGWRSKLTSTAPTPSSRARALARGREAEPPTTFTAASSGTAYFKPAAPSGFEGGLPPGGDPSRNPRASHDLEIAIERERRGDPVPVHQHLRGAIRVGDALVGEAREHPVRLPLVLLRDVQNPEHGGIPQEAKSLEGARVSAFVEGRGEPLVDHEMGGVEEPVRQVSGG